MKTRQLQNLLLKQIETIQNNNIQDSSKLSQMIDDVMKHFTTPKGQVDVEDALIDNGIVPKLDAIKVIKRNIKPVDTKHLSKNKAKKVHKANQRIEKTLDGVKKVSINWFMLPTGKKAKPVKKNATKNLFDELIEFLGAYYLPDELIAKQQQEAVKNN